MRTARDRHGIGAPFVCEGATILDDVLVIERREDAHLVLDRLRDTAEMSRLGWATCLSARSRARLALIPAAPPT